MTAVPIGLGWALALVAFLTVAVIAVELVRGWLLAGRILAEPSPPSDDFAFGVLIAMDDRRAPHERRHA